MFNTTLNSLSSSFEIAAFEAQQTSEHAQNINGEISPIQSIWEEAGPFIYDTATRMASSIFAASSGAMLAKGLISGSLALGFSKGIISLGNPQNDQIDLVRTNEMKVIMLNNFIKHIGLTVLFGAFCYNERPDLVLFNTHVLVVTTLAVAIKELSAFRNL